MNAAVETMTGGEALVRSLVAEGIDTLFGLPGVQLDPMFNALHDAGNAVRVVNARHEQSVAYMAFGYARSTGRVGAYAVVPGPGLLNTTAALSTAYGCNEPVLALTGQIPSHAIGRGLGMLHEIPDQLGVMRGLTKYAARIDHPADAPGLVSEAFRQMRSGRPRPAGLEMAMDTMARSAPVAPGGGRTPGDPPPPLDLDGIGRAAKILGAAARPMIFVGGGANHAAEEVRELAEMLQAPVVAYQNGRGIVDERHWLGHVATSGAMLWERCDAALAIGSRFRERAEWGIDDDVRIVHIDIDPTEPSRAGRPDVAIVADAAEAARALVDALGPHNRARPSREEEALEAKARAARLMEEKAGPQMAWLRALRAALPEDGLLVDEFTQVGYMSRVGFPVYRPRAIVTPGYQGTLGYGYATALGVKVAHPDRPVLSISGDGGFMYTMPEIATAIHHGIDLVAVVFADGAYGNVLRMQRELHGGRVIASEFTNPDFVRLAESFGALGLRAETPDALAAAIAAGFDSGRPTLVEVPVGVFPEPFDVIRPPPTRGRKART